MDYQSNTQPGRIVRPTASSLLSYLGRVVKMTSSAGQAVFGLPTASDDYVAYVIDDVNAYAPNVAAMPLSPDRNARAKLLGTCSVWDVLVLATIDGTSDGMLMKLPTTPGTYRAVGLAEEAGVDGQLVLFRPQAIGNITVSA